MKSQALSPEFLKQELDILSEKGKVSGASIAVFHEGEILTAVTGWANVPAQIEVTDDTIFQIGSITKVFTATLLHKLAEIGKVDLNAPVTNYLPDLKIDGASPPASLTVRSLLNYSAGMVGDYFDDFGPDPRSLEQYVAACSDLKWIHRPGEMRAYNSTSYCIAGRVIEIVTGLYFNEALTKLLLHPLAVTRFGFYDHDVVRYRTAIGHEYNSKSQTFNAVNDLRLPHCMSAAGASLTLSAKDLLKFGMLHLNNGLLSDGSRYMKASSVTDMQTPTKVVPPNDSELISGWATLNSNKGKIVVASGATQGQNSFLCFLPNHELAISILANTQTGAEQLFTGLGLQILHQVADAKPNMPGPAEDLKLNSITARMMPEEAKPFTGTYSNQTLINVSYEDKELKVTISAKSSSSAQVNSESGKLVSVEPNKFVYVKEGEDKPSFGLEFLFVNEAQNSASHIFGANRLFVRV